MEPGYDDLGTADWQLLPRLQRACRCRLDHAGDTPAAGARAADAAAAGDRSAFSDDAAADLTRRVTQLVLTSYRAPWHGAPWRPPLKRLESHPRAWTTALSDITESRNIEASRTVGSTPIGFIPPTEHKLSP